MSTIYVQREDTDEIFAIAVSPSEEKAMTAELEDVIVGLGPLSDADEVLFSTHVATAIFHGLVERRLSRGQAVLTSATALDAALEVTGLNPSEVNVLERFRSWGLGKLLGPFLREGFALLVHPHVLLALETDDLKQLGLATMADRKTWKAMLGHIGQQCVLADARVKDTVAGKGYLELYDSYLSQLLPQSTSSSSSMAPSSSASSVDPQAKSRNRNRTRKKKALAARLRAVAEQKTFGSDQVSGLEEPESDKGITDLQAGAEPEAEPGGR